MGGMPRRWHGTYEQNNDAHPMEMMMVVDYQMIRGEGKD
jgi:hypothetical protein